MAPEAVTDISAAADPEITPDHQPPAAKPPVITGWFARIPCWGASIFPPN